MLLRKELPPAPMPTRLLQPRALSALPSQLFPGAGCEPER